MSRVRAFKEWWSSRTLKFRLAFWYSVGGVLLLAGFSSTIYVYVAERLATPIGFPLRQDLELIKQRLRVTPDGSTFWDGSLVALDHPTTDHPWFELWNEHGELVRRVGLFSDQRWTEPPRAPARRSETISIFYVTPDIRVRALAVPFRPEGGGSDWMIRVMRLHQPSADALVDLRWIIVCTLPIVVGALVIGGYVITRHWLGPLAKMVSQAKEITAQNLERRLSVNNPRDELGQLATVFNDTMDRLQASFMALDRFMGDAAHELRTPLSTLRSVGEVGLRRNRTLNEANDVIGSMLEEARRLETLTHRLLELARAEGGPAVTDIKPIDLSRSVRACAEDFALLAETKGQRIHIEEEVCFVDTDPLLFIQALQNLVQNALKYSPERTTVTIAVGRKDGFVEVSVADEGPGIQSDARERLMQRFYRTDTARTRATGGYGLGLSICKAYMRMLGGELLYRPGSPTGSVFSLRLPLTRTNGLSHPMLP